jgi:hypothetical protein
MGGRDATCTIHDTPSGGRDCGLGRDAEGFREENPPTRPTWYYSRCNFRWASWRMKRSFGVEEGCGKVKCFEITVAAGSDTRFVIDESAPWAGRPESCVALPIIMGLYRLGKPLTLKPVRCA